MAKLFHSYILLFIYLGKQASILWNAMESKTATTASVGNSQSHAIEESRYF